MSFGLLRLELLNSVFPIMPIYLFRSSDLLLEYILLYYSAFSIFAAQLDEIEKLARKDKIEKIFQFVDWKVSLNISFMDALHHD